MRLAGFLFFMLALVCPDAFAQGTVTLFGNVTDSSGGAVGGAPVTVTSDTGLSRRTVSDAAGAWIVPQLPVAGYSVRIEAPGFKAFVLAGIQPQVNENRRIDAVLEIGAVTEAVNVTAEAAQVETRQGSIKEVIDSKRIVELPLNGRNPLQLQYLVSGVGARTVASGGQAQNESVSINGARSNSNNYMLDGGDNQDPFFNSPSIFPSPDALQEFSVETNAYGADRGRNAGASMTAITKSGTNDFHGTLFEFLRNDKLNARNFFAVDVPPFRRNQYGGTIGGRLRRDRTFFFVSYQGTKERSSPASTTANVPSPAQRRGDFSAQPTPVRDPNGGVFPGNVIPASRQYQPSQRFLDAFVPLPNFGNLLSFASQQSINDDQFTAKLDHRFSDANSAFVRLLHNRNDPRQATGNLPGFFASIPYWNWNVTGTDTHVFSPSVINSISITFNKIDRRQLSVVPGNKTWTDFGVPFVRSFTGDLPAAHDTQVDNYFQAFSRFPLDQLRKVYDFADTLSINAGSHFLRVGAVIRRSELERPETFRGDPFVRFRNTFTGDAFADFLLGRPTQIIQNSPSVVQPRGGEWTFFVQDDWRATSRLTFNLGLRWEPFLPYYDKEDRRAALRLGEQSKAFPQAPPGLIFAGDAGTNRALIQRRWANFGPRFGFAWDPLGNARMSVRGGYGIFYDAHRLQGYGGAPGYSLGLQINNPPGGLADPYRTTGNPWPYQAPVTAQDKAGVRFVQPLNFGFDNHDFRNSVTQQWNFNLQRQFGRSWIGTAAYVGSKGNHLYNGNQVNAPVFGAPGRTLDERRPLFPFYGSVTNDMSAGNSTYHSLQLSLNKRFSSGFTLLANYTWSKLLDDSSDDGNSPANPNCIACEKGRSAFDIPHRFVASFIWELPSPQGGSRPVRALLGGWETNGILTLESGRGFNIVSGRDNSQTAINADRADVVGDWRLSSDRPKADRLASWFNTSAFAQNRAGSFGNSGRNIVQGPGNAGIDFGLIKTTALSESHRLQFRAEAFNLFNRANFSNPNNNQSARNFGVITSAGAPRVFQLALKYMF